MKKDLSGKNGEEKHLPSALSFFLLSPFSSLFVAFFIVPLPRASSLQTLRPFFSGPPPRHPTVQPSLASPFDGSLPVLLLSIHLSHGVFQGHPDRTLSVDYHSEATARLPWSLYHLSTRRLETSCFVWASTRPRRCAVTVLGGQRTSPLSSTSKGTTASDHR